jgi:hypothetical protein
VREAVGHVRLEGVQAYHQLREVYRALRLVVNCFQPSVKLQARVPRGGRMRRIYDVARTPLHRLLVSGILPGDRQQELSARVQQIDPLLLSEHLDALRHALFCHAHLPAVLAATRPHLTFALTICTSEPLVEQETGPEPRECQEPLPSTHEILSWPRTTRDPLAGAWEEVLALVQAHPEWNSTQILQELGRRDPERELPACSGTVIQGVARIRQQVRACWEELWPSEVIQAASFERLDAPPQTGGVASPPLDESPAPPAPIADQVSTPSQDGAALHPSSSALENTAADKTASSPLIPANHHRQTRPLVVMTIERAITMYLRDVYERGREVKTVEWHQLSLTCAGYLRHPFVKIRSKDDKEKRE